VYKGLTRFK